jgi:hypothetical protein
MDWHRLKVGSAVRQIATGRIGQVMIHDVVDAQLTFKVRFFDGSLPETDWVPSRGLEVQQLLTSVDTQLPKGSVKIATFFPDGLTDDFVNDAAFGLDDAQLTELQNELNGGDAQPLIQNQCSCEGMRVTVAMPMCDPSSFIVANESAADSDYGLGEDQFCTLNNVRSTIEETVACAQQQQQLVPKRNSENQMHDVDRQATTVSRELKNLLNQAHQDCAHLQKRIRRNEHPRLFHYLVCNRAAKVERLKRELKELAAIEEELSDKCAEEEVRREDYCRSSF